MEQIRELDDMVTRVEENMAKLVDKPSTRVQACQLLANAKELQREVSEFVLPDLEAEYTDEEGDRLDEALDRYNVVRQKLADVQAKAETLCVCWNKLDQDVTELTKLLKTGGGSKVTIDRLDTSISQLRDMFTVRQTIEEKLSVSATDALAPPSAQ